MKVVVCGARRPGAQSALTLARELGREIARAGFEIVTGATIGATFEAVCGAKEEGGKTFGVSPAKDKLEHTKKYGYPTENFDEIEFTGAGVPGRNILLVQKADVILFVGGGVGTLNEFSIALQKEKLIGVLEGVEGVSGNAQKILEIVGWQDYPKIVSSKGPKELIQKIKEKIGK